MPELYRDGKRVVRVYRGATEILTRYQGAVLRWERPIQPVPVNASIRSSLSFRYSASATAPNKNLSAPAGTQAGDILIFLATMDHGVTSDILYPPGFTQLYYRDMGQDKTKFMAAYRVVTTAEPANYNFAAPLNSEVRMDFLCIKDWSGSADEIVAAEHVHTPASGSTSVLLPSMVTPKTPRNLALAVAAQTSDTASTWSWAPPDRYTERHDLMSNQFISQTVAERVLNTMTPDSPASGTFTVTTTSPETSFNTATIIIPSGSTLFTELPAGSSYDDFETDYTGITGRPAMIGPATWGGLRSGGTNVYSYTQDGVMKPNLDGAAYLDMYLDTTLADCIVTARLRTLGPENASLVFRRTGPSDMLRITAENKQWVIRFAGSPHTFAAMGSPGNANDGDLLRVTLSGQTVKVELNGTVIRDSSIAGVSATGVRHGFRFEPNTASSEWDYISVEPLPTPQTVYTTPVIRSQTIASVASGTTNKAMARPAGVVAGDLLLLVIGISSGTGLAVPSGFTELATRALDSVNPTVKVAYKIATGSEPTTYTPTIPSGITYRADLFRIDSYQVGSLPVVTTMASTGSSTVHSVPSVTPATPAGLLLTNVSTRATTGTATTFSWTPPTGMSEVTDNTANSLYSMSTATQALTTADPTGVRTSALTRNPAETRPGTGVAISVPALQS